MPLGLVIVFRIAAKKAPPPGLKPAILGLALRGAEAPLFHGSSSRRNIERSYLIQSGHQRRYLCAGVRCSANRWQKKFRHSSIPSPLFAETRKISIPGRTA
jgi:hypothetical protein